MFGDNRAPIAEVLPADHADLVAEINRACVDAKNRTPAKITTENELTDAGKIITELRALAKKADGVRSDEKAPIIETGRAIDGFFRDLIQMIDGAITPLRSAADDFARRRAAEEAARRRREEEIAREKAAAAQKRAENAKSPEAAAKAAAEQEAQEAVASGAAQAKTQPVRGNGVTAGTRKTWDFEILDSSALRQSLGALGPFLDEASLEKAIRSFVKIHKGSTALPGVRAFEKTTTQFRA
ncbi:hypothetical protein AN189_07425 [Loktanella sp. 3ANDIMAR09]|nr:hypothetical protein AN189_07425 [Loktanella sp. 3ANDIMAR09]